MFWRRFRFVDARDRVRLLGANGSFSGISFSCRVSGSPYAVEGSLPWRRAAAVSCPDHRFAAPGAKHWLGFGLLLGLFRFFFAFGSELLAYGLELFLGSAVKETVVTQSMEAIGQSMLQVPAEELHTVDLNSMELFRVSVLDRNGDGPVVPA